MGMYVGNEISHVSIWRCNMANNFEMEVKVTITPMINVCGKYKRWIRLKRYDKLYRFISRKFSHLFIDPKATITETRSRTTDLNYIGFVPLGTLKNYVTYTIDGVIMYHIHSQLLITAQELRTLGFFVTVDKDEHMLIDGCKNAKCGLEDITINFTLGEPIPAKDIYKIVDLISTDQFKFDIVPPSLFSTVADYVVLETLGVDTFELKCQYRKHFPRSYVDDFISDQMKLIYNELGIPVTKADVKYND